MLEDFGFHIEPQRKKTGELVMTKLFVPPPNAAHLGPLDHHITYGPGAVMPVASQIFIVPVKPEWARLLLPDVETFQYSLFAPKPVANAMRKAYLANANLRTMRPGATLLFYLSQRDRTVRAVGVLENALVSRDPATVASFVGKRTVYSMSDITGMCEGRDVPCPALSPRPHPDRPPHHLRRAQRAWTGWCPPVHQHPARRGGGNVVEATSGRIALLSIHPEFAEAIMDGEKRVEFRKQSLRPDVQQALVYSTSPVKRIVGVFHIERIDRATPTQLWERYAEVGCISHKAFWTYYAAHAMGAAIIIADAQRLAAPLALNSLGGDVRAPQSYRYIEASRIPSAAQPATAFAVSRRPAAHP